MPMRVLDADGLLRPRLMQWPMLRLPMRLPVLLMMLMLMPLLMLLLLPGWLQSDGFASREKLTSGRYNQDQDPAASMKATAMAAQVVRSTISVTR